MEQNVNEKLIEIQSRTLLEVLLRLTAIEKILLEKKIITAEEHSENFSSLAKNLTDVIKNNMPTNDTKE